MNVVPDMDRSKCDAKRNGGLNLADMVIFWGFVGVAGG